MADKKVPLQDTITYSDLRIRRSIDQVLAETNMPLYLMELILSRIISEMRHEMLNETILTRKPAELTKDSESENTDKEDKMGE